MSVVAVRLNCSHLKDRVPLSPSLVNHLYRCVIAALAIVHKTKKPDAQLFLQHREYQHDFTLAMQTPQPEQVIVNLGLVEPPWQFLDINEQLDEFFTQWVSEKRDNVISLKVDTDYHLVVSLRRV